MRTSSPSFDALPISKHTFVRCKNDRAAFRQSSTRTACDGEVSLDWIRSIRRCTSASSNPTFDPTHCPTLYMIAACSDRQHACLPVIFVRGSYAGSEVSHSNSPVPNVRRFASCVFTSGRSNLLRHAQGTSRAYPHDRRYLGQISRVCTFFGLVRAMLHN